MKIEKRNNIDPLLPFKINVSPGNFRKIQHMLFSKGCEWKTSGKVLFSMHIGYVFVDKNKKMSLTLDGDYFNEHKNTLIKEEDIL